MPENERESPWQRAALFLFTLAALMLCAFILRPFFSALVGAIVLAAVTQHPYNWLSRKIRNRSLCAATALVLVVLAVIIPIFLLAQNLAGQALDAVIALRTEANQQRFADYLAHHPALNTQVRAITAPIDLNNTARATATYIAAHLAELLSTSAHIITQIVVMLFILFFLFRDRPLALQFLRSLLPLREYESTELLQRLDDTVLATTLGRLAIAALQGLLAGFGYWALGVPQVVLWAVCTTLLSMIPAFGAILIWGPIAVYLGLNGHWGKAAILAFWGGVIVSTIDNFLYPVLVGTRLRAHTVAILISILGGIALFGISGIILGPVIFSLADTLLDFWRAHNAEHSTA